MEGLRNEPQSSRTEQIQAALAMIESTPELSNLAAVQEMIDNDFVSPAGDEVDPQVYLAKVAELHANGQVATAAEIIAIAKQNAADSHWDPRREDAENRPN